jgi:hypothetical protein
MRALSKNFNHEGTKDTKVSQREKLCETFVSFATSWLNSFLFVEVFGCD